jgi:hypothetical protein
LAKFEPPQKENFKSEVSELTRPPLSIYICHIKRQSMNPHSDLDLSGRSSSLVQDTPYINGYFICERKITILPYILKFQIRHNHHLLYLYNIKNDKV